MDAFQYRELDPEVIDAIEKLDPEVQERFLALLEKASEYAQLREETVRQPYFAPFPPSIAEN